MMPQTMLDPHRWPIGYMIYWMVVLVMLAWLAGLEFIDLLQTRQMFRKASEDNKD